jgi:hypothetical protein
MMFVDDAKTQPYEAAQVVVARSGLCWGSA